MAVVLYVSIISNCFAQSWYCGIVHIQQNVPGALDGVLYVHVGLTYALV